MTARLSKPVEIAAAEAEVVACLIRAAHTVSRTEAAGHLLDAMAAGLPLADATRALAEWDEAHQ